MRFSHIRALVPADSERYQDKKIPADNTYVKQVRHPEAFSDSQRQDQGNPLGKHHSAHSSKERYQVRDKWIHLECPHMKRKQRRQEVQHLQYGEAESCIQYLQREKSCLAVVRFQQTPNGLQLRSASLCSDRTLLLPPKQQADYGQKNCR